jgi:hypothetical protein
MAAKNMNPPIAQRAVLGAGSSPGVWVTIWLQEGVLVFPCFLYKTTTRCKGNTDRAEILDSSVRKFGRGL